MKPEEALFLGASMGHLLVVEDDELHKEWVASVASDLGYTVSLAGSKAEALHIQKTLRPTALLLDLSMPDGDGVETLRDLAALECDAPIVLVSGHDSRVLKTAERIGKGLGLIMIQSLQKPVPLGTLEASLQSLRRDRTVINRRVGEALGEVPAWLTPARIMEAVQNGEISLHFQPKISLLNPLGPEVKSAEGLARWQHPAYGAVPPGLFIPIAEAAGIIGDLTEYLLRALLDEQCRWLAQGVRCPIALNLSPLQLGDLSLPDRIVEALDESGIDPALLCVEVTEQAAMADIAVATDVLTRLRLKGVSVALDDFGTGYSSLVELYRLPLSELKFDRSLVMDLATDPDARTVLRALLALAKKLGIPVCAEGVETTEQVVFLRQAGCDVAQGFLFAKAMPAERFLSYLASTRSQRGSGQAGTWDSVLAL